jgi:uncharacterized protein
MKYECFDLVLMVTHACNLRCDYCYVGRKRPQSMDPLVGRKAIDRAVRSIQPGGLLELGFFGGEPLLEAELVADLMGYACQSANAHGISLRMGLTTNGTLREGAAWDVLSRDDLDVCVSHDGLPEVHDRHRRTADGRGDARDVLATIERLLGCGRPVRAVVGVRPDTVGRLSEGVQWLRERGLREIDLTLDVWASWRSGDMRVLEKSLAAVARLWAAAIPELAINWFDEKAARLARIPIPRSGRCGFGDGQIAVAPSGNLYPCERLIGEDDAAHPMRLPGHVAEGDDFCFSMQRGQATSECAACVIQTYCGATCRCNNYVRTGNPERPDGLLCFVEKVCSRESALALGQLSAGRSDRSRCSGERR